MPKFTKAGSRWPGVEYYESQERRHNGRPDRCYYIRYRNSHGKLVREKVGWTSEGYTPQVSSTIRGERLRAVRHGEELPKRHKIEATLNEVAQHYFEHRGKEIKGSYKDQNRWKIHFVGGLGEKSIPEISALDLEILQHGLRKKEVAVGTIWNILELLRRIINYGAELELCSRPKFKIKMPKKNNITTELLTHEQWNELLAVLAEYPDQNSANMIKFALFTGLRKSEVFGLKWEDIDIKNLLVHIRDPKSGNDETIPLNQIALQAIQDQSKNESEYVFPGRGGRARVDSRAARRVKKIAKLPDNFRPWHGLRHAFASALAESGNVELYHIQKLLRHRSPQMVQRYAHLRNEALLKSSNILADIISESGSDNTTGDDK